MVVIFLWIIKICFSLGNVSIFFFFWMLWFFVCLFVVENGILFKGVNGYLNYYCIVLCGVFYLGVCV